MYRGLYTFIATSRLLLDLALVDLFERPRLPLPQLVITNLGGQINSNGSVAFPASISDQMKKWAYYVIDYNQVGFKSQPWPFYHTCRVLVSRNLN